MSSAQKHVRHGQGAVRPYLYGGLDVIEFIKGVFDASELERIEYQSGGFHLELKIGDSVLVLEACDDPPARATRASIYVYVPDADEAFQRAIKAGARWIEKPEDKPYGERQAGVMDSFGNTWWIATCMPSSASHPLAAAAGSPSIPNPPRGASDA